MVLGSAIAGLAGGLAGIFYGAISYAMFVTEVTFTVYLMVIIGGRANNRSVRLGAILCWLLQKGTTDLVDLFPPIGGLRTSAQILQLGVFGVLLIVILYYRPEGILAERRYKAE